MCQWVLILEKIAYGARSAACSTFVIIKLNFKEQTNTHRHGIRKALFHIITTKAINIYQYLARQMTQNRPHQKPTNSSSSSLFQRTSNVTTTASAGAGALSQKNNPQAKVASTGASNDNFPTHHQRVPMDQQIPMAEQIRLLNQQRVFRQPLSKDEQVREINQRQ